MGTHASANGTDTTPIGAVTCGPIYSSTKSYLEIPAEDGTLRVPVRRISLTDDTTFDVYDTSGPYTEYSAADECHDLASGLPPTRLDWTHPEAVRASADDPTRVRTQLAWARAGHITPEMRFIAAREGIDVEVVRSEVAAGRAVIPANHRHPESEPMIIGKRFLTEITA
ncbi:MAG: phosphomethylpyrimidine synthase ThiC, partial [Dietzia sp.]